MALKVPSGNVLTRRPNSSAAYGIPWTNVSRWEPSFTNASNEQKGVAPPQLLAAMAIVESDATQTVNGKVISRDDGFGDGPSIGIMQVKPKIWQSLLPTADPMTPDGNIRLGAAIMAKATKEHGSWQKAITTVYFPANDPNGTTQNAYVATVQALMDEMAGHGTTPVEVDPIRVIVGGSYGAITYGFGSDAGLDYYSYGTGHGTSGDTKHTGVDVPVPRGTVLRTPCDGVVLCVGNAGGPGAAGWGNACGAYPDADGSGASGNITILFDVGSRLTLGHCSAFNVGVGQRVHAGDVVGRSGGMNGPHVHVEMAICDQSKVNMAIAHYPGCYFLVEPVAALKAAMAGHVPAVYPERLPISQPDDTPPWWIVQVTADSVPVLQYGDASAPAVAPPLQKGETFNAQFQLPGTDGKGYWISTQSGRVPIDGTKQIKVVTK